MNDQTRLRDSSITELRALIRTERETRHWSDREWRNECGFRWRIMRRRLRQKADEAIDELIERHETTSLILQGHRRFYMSLSRDNYPDASQNKLEDLLTSFEANALYQVNEIPTSPATTIFTEKPTQVPRGVVSRPFGAEHLREGERFD